MAKQDSSAAKLSSADIFAKIPIKSSKGKASKMPNESADRNTRMSVDAWLEAHRELDEVKAKLEAAAESLREFALERIVKDNTVENFTLVGTSGTVQIQLKNAFGKIPDVDAFRGLLTRLGEANPGSFMAVEESLKFNVDKMSKQEKISLRDFMLKTFGEARAAVLATYDEFAKATNLVDQFPRLVKGDRANLDDLRQVANHYAPSVGEYKSGKR